MLLGSTLGAGASVVVMTPGSHARADDGPERTTPRRAARGASAPPRWCCCAASLFVVSAANSEGTDLRPGRYTDLAVAREDRVRAVRRPRSAGSRSSTRRSRSLTAAVDDDTVKRIQRRIERMRGPRRPHAAHRPGRHRDPVRRARRTSSTPRAATSTCSSCTSRTSRPWSTRCGRPAPTAVTIQGQRVVSTTGIKCEGNSVQLQGVPYPPPYEITAVGDQSALLEAIATDDYLEIYRTDADEPEHLGRLGPRARGRGDRAGVRRPARHHLRRADPLTVVPSGRPGRDGSPAAVGDSVGRLGLSVGVSVGDGSSSAPRRPRPRW